MDDKLRTLYPDAPDGSWELRDNGDNVGVFIYRWNPALGPKPSLDVVNAVDSSDIEAKKQAMSALVGGDKKMARLIEDVVDVLVSKGLFEIDDLPQPAQDLIADRKTNRSKL